MSATDVAARIVERVSRVLTGKREVIELAVTALLARGHLLVEDVPGVGKTTLARALARSVGANFRRLQFTSDMLPADVLGGSVWDPKSGTFSFRPGPIFTPILLADEINRTTPRTQSALLEAMEERRVSLEGETRTLDEPFFVVATQNPEEFAGTYPLPESQLDRFLIRTEIGYPERSVERELLASRRGPDPVEAIEPVITLEALLEAQKSVAEVRSEPPVLDYLHEIVLATRQSPLLELGASTRAALSFERAVRAHAIVSGRAFVTLEDVKILAVPVLAHRVRLAGARDVAKARRDAARVVRDAVERLPVPV